MESGRSILPGRRHPVLLVPDHAALGEDVRPLRRGNALERAPDDLFRVAQPVHRRGVDPVDPPLDGVPDRGDRLLVVLRAPAEGPAAAADGPRAEADGGDGPCPVVPSRRVVSVVVMSGMYSAVGHSTVMEISACCPPAPSARMRWVPGTSVQRVRRSARRQPPLNRRLDPENAARIDAPVERPRHRPVEGDRNGGRRGGVRSGRDPEHLQLGAGIGRQRESGGRDEAKRRAIVRGTFPKIGRCLDRDLYILVPIGPPVFHSEKPQDPAGLREEG